MKYYYLAVQIEENGKFAAYVVRFCEHDNLVCLLSRIKNIKSANLYPKHFAEALCEEWNETFRANNTYLYS